MNRKLIITSISNDNNRILKIIRDGCLKNNIEFIIVGDKKSPENFNLEGATFLSIDTQENLGFGIENLLPKNHYSRKNLGYLEAIRRGSEIIIDTDDDNIPKENFWDIPSNNEKLPNLINIGWVNVYKYFTDKKIWPRGFPLNKVSNIPPSLKNFKNEKVRVPIRQGLADGNPDVDAIYRMLGDLPVEFEKHENIALGKGSICPFNSQNTQFFPEAYPLLYLPSYCSFRMTDIWRSFIAQVIAWKFGWSIGYFKPTVIQERNDHDLMKDFEDEIQGYLNNEKILETLISVNLDSNLAKIFDNLFLLYEELVRKKLIDHKELGLLSKWIDDFKIINY